MSNFLTHLVTRSLAPTPDLLRPKLPSLFEAAAGSEPMPEESSGILTRDETVETNSVADTVHGPRFERDRMREDERNSSPQKEPIHAVPERHRAAAQTILPLVSEKPVPTSIEVPRSEHVIAPSIIRAESVSQDLKQAGGPRSEALMPFVNDNDRSETDQKVSARLVSSPSKLEKYPPIPQIENNMDAKPFPSEDRSPTVHIHIGRIEVRAVTQPAPPVRASTPQRPKVTLDEYLHRRNEGKR